ncbi:MAG: hypothetical protein OEW87_00545, partial [Flavobacteriaceae bacterium]|nr:hypothetical protein [Flavobacteriaceae bacterium]
FFIIVLLLINYASLYGQDEEVMEDATILLNFLEEEDGGVIVATVTDQNGLPIEELDLFFYVKRTFSLLPIGDVFNTTDDEGVVEVKFPNDLPGDSEGNVTIVVKIIESDLYNDLSIETTKNWGIPVKIDDSEEKRSLWAAAANAPITLVLIVSGMILAIWFINCYIIYILYKISKIKPVNI